MKTESKLQARTKHATVASHRIHSSEDPGDLTDARKGRVQRLLEARVDAGVIVPILIIAALQAMLDAVAQVLEDAHVLEPIIVRLGLASLGLSRGRADRRHIDVTRLGCGGAVRGAAGTAGALQDTTRKAALIVGEVGAEAGRGRVRQVRAVG